MDKVAMAGNWVRVISEHPRRAPFFRSSGSGSAPTLQDTGSPPPVTSPLVCWTHPEWEQRFPWLVQGTTGRSPGETEGDFRLFDPEGSPEENRRWFELARCSGFAGVRHARQVHGKEVLIHMEPGTGLTLGPDADGHATSSPGTLMGVTVADCVPVFLVDPLRRAVGLLHAGWRGTAKGILEEGISLLKAKFRAADEDILLHLGPAICEVCYEVGPEVHTALGLPRPQEPAPVDLRGVLAERAVDLGLLPSHITRSSFCTLCNGSPFFSHRGGESKRQVGFLGIRFS